MNPKALLAACLAAGCVLVSVRAGADLMFNVALNTAPLVGNPNGPFSIDLQLGDGSGMNDANNAATISSVSLGGGSLVGSPVLFGGAAGSLASTLSLTDSDFVNGIVQSFDAGAALSFDVSLTTDLDSGPFPDELSLSLLDGLGNPIPTTGLLSAFLVIDIDSAHPAIQLFAGSGPYATIGAPLLSPVGRAPEPATLLLIAISALSCALDRRRAKATL